MKALVLAVTLTLCLAASRALAAPIHLEAENARLAGPTVDTERQGFSGTGYVTGFEKDSDKITWTIPNVAAGLYDLRIRYASPYDQKGYDLVINGVTASNMFTQTAENAYATSAAGKVSLRNGTNTISIGGGWGYYDIDAIDLVPATIEKLAKPSKVLADRSATDKARSLMSYLIAFYGRTTLSGQYDQADTNIIRTQAGKTPCIFASDLIEYSPSRIAHGANPGNLSEQVIATARKGQAISLSWHWNAPSGLYDKTYTDAQGNKIEAPWYMGFNANATSFDLKKALANPQGNDYKLLLSDMDAIAAQLKKFSDADVPVLWRPLHEAEGAWFWWGAKGPEPFKQLWKLMFDRFTNVHHLHNLIWVYSSGTNPAWYPGDAYVDVVGIDAYPDDVTDSLSGTWDTLLAQYAGRKLIALTEFGGVPDIDKMRLSGVRWSYFVSWTGDLGPAKMSKDVLARIYQSNVVLTQDEFSFK